MPRRWPPLPQHQGHDPQRLAHAAEIGELTFAAAFVAEANFERIPSLKFWLPVRVRRVVAVPSSSGHRPANRRGDSPAAHNLGARTLRHNALFYGSGLVVRKTVSEIIPAARAFAVISRTSWSNAVM